MEKIEMMQRSENPLISVIVPVYNVAKYLPTCLDSIINQTYNNLEIIIIASESDDNSVEICDEYSMKDSRIIVIHSPPNGLSDARNRGIDVSHGEYLSFIDSDDFIAPDFLQILYNIIEEFECDIAQAEYFCVPVEQNTIPDIYYTKSSPTISIYSNREMLKLMNKTNIYYTMTWGKLYHHSLLSEIRFPIGKIQEDVATTYKIYYKSTRIGHMRESLYFYRMNPTGITAMLRTSENRLDIVEHVEDMVIFFKEREEWDIYRMALVHQIVSVHSVVIRTRKYWPELKHTQQQLKKNVRKAYSELKEQRGVGVYYKVAAFLMTYMPNIAEVLLIVRRWFISKKYSRGHSRSVQKNTEN